MRPSVVSIIVANVWLTAFFGLGIFAALQMRRDGSMLYRSTRTGRTYRRSSASRVMAAGLGLLLFLGAPATILATVTQPNPRHPMPAWGWALAVLLVLIGLASGAFMFLISGPNEIQLDLERRTYRYLYGWRHKPQLRTGPMDEMAGVFVRRQQDSETRSYQVGIAWKSGQGACPSLGFFGRSDRASRFADETAAALGLPRVDPPFRGGTSASVRRL